MISLATLTALAFPQRHNRWVIISSNFLAPRARCVRRQSELQTCPAHSFKEIPKVFSERTMLFWDARILFLWCRIASTCKPLPKRELGEPLHRKTKMISLLYLLAYYFIISYTLQKILAGKREVPRNDHAFRNTCQKNCSDQMCPIRFSIPRLRIVAHPRDIRPVSAICTTSAQDQPR